MTQWIELTSSFRINTKAFNDRANTLLTDEVVEILINAHKTLNLTRLNLLKIREENQKEFDNGKLPSYIDGHPASAGNWQVATIPEDLQQRRVEITGPINNAKMVINMLSENANGDIPDMAMLDFEDSMMPAWSNVIDGLYNIIGVAKGDLTYTQPAEGNKPEKTYTLNPQKMAHPMVRLRGLHLEESNIEIDGQKISAGLFDLVMTAYHSSKIFLEKNMTPKFYIPKCEHFEESRWWNSLFEFAEKKIGLPTACLRATFLIETLPAAFQMEEILYEFKDRVCGLNGGRWDKIFSDIKVLKNHPDRIMADRATIDMLKPWMDNYAKRLIKICHKHGAFAMGGMSAFTPGKDAKTREAQIEKVRADKAREAQIGHDGCWVSHPFFVGMAMEQFKNKNQLSVMLEDFPDRPNLIPQGNGPKTLKGLRTNIRVGIAYMEGWNREVGCVAFDNLMEDLATLEISRAQTWQWLNHKVKLDDGETVSSELIKKLFEEEYDKIVSEFKAEFNFQESDSAFEELKKGYKTAKEDACKLFLQDKLSNFITNSSPLA